MECSGSYTLTRTREGSQRFGVSDYAGYFVYGGTYDGHSVMFLYVHRDLTSGTCTGHNLGVLDTNVMDKKTMKNYSFINFACGKVKLRKKTKKG